MNKIREATLSWHQTKGQNCDSWEKWSIQGEKTCVCSDFLTHSSFQSESERGETQRDPSDLTELSSFEFGLPKWLGFEEWTLKEENCGEERTQKSMWACLVAPWVKPGLGESRARVGEAYQRATTKNLRTRWKCQRLCLTGSSSSAEV